MELHQKAAASGLPEGLNMNASGVLSGAPNEQGTFNVALRIAGNYGLNFIKGSSEINLTVGAFEEVPVENVTIEANTAMLGETYTGAISGSPIPEDAQWAEGVDGAYGKEYQQSDIGKYASKSYTVTGLPKGLTVNSDTGEITGTPTEAGEFVVTVTMTYQKVILVYTNGTIFVYGAGDPETYTGQYTFTVNGGFNVSFNTNGGAMISYVPTPSPYPGVNLPPKEVRTTKLNIGVEDGKTVTFGEIKSQVVEPVNGDSSFLGWATAADAFAPDVTDATVFDTEITLYAVWGSSN